MADRQIVVRLATQEDQSFVGRDGYISDTRLRDKIDAGEVFLVSQGQRPCGYLRLEFLWSILPYIALIWVREDARGKGLSRALLTFVEDHLASRGHTVLYSSSQLDEPQPQAWHRHMGFEECGVINGINDGGIGEVFFRKQFREPDHAR